MHRYQPRFAANALQKRIDEWKRLQWNLHADAKTQRENPPPDVKWLQGRWKELGLDGDPNERWSWPFDFYLPLLRNSFRHYIVNFPRPQKETDFFRMKGYCVFDVIPHDETSLQRVVSEVQRLRLSAPR